MKISRTKFLRLTHSKNWLIPEAVFNFLLKNCGHISEQQQKNDWALDPWRKWWHDENFDALADLVNQFGVDKIMDEYNVRQVTRYVEFK